MLIYLWVVICIEYVHCNVHKLHTTTQADPLWSGVPGSDCNWREDGAVRQGDAAVTAAATRISMQFECTGGSGEECRTGTAQLLLHLNRIDSTVCVFAQNGMKVNLPLCAAVYDSTHTRGEVHSPKTGDTITTTALNANFQFPGSPFCSLCIDEDGYREPELGYRKRVVEEEAGRPSTFKAPVGRLQRHDDGLRNIWNAFILWCIIKGTNTAHPS